MKNSEDRREAPNAEEMAERRHEPCYTGERHCDYPHDVCRLGHLTERSDERPASQSGAPPPSHDDVSDAVARVTTAYRAHFSSSAICDEVHGAITRELLALLASPAATWGKR